MRIISFAAIREFIKVHTDADITLRDWYKKTEKAEWICLADIKQTFNSVDYIGNDRYVFNVKGNHYRLVAIVLFAAKKVFIRFIETIVSMTIKTGRMLNFAKCETHVKL